jgi:hypothetical protein
MDRPTQKKAKPSNSNQQKICARCAASNQSRIAIDWCCRAERRHLRRTCEQLTVKIGALDEDKPSPFPLDTHRTHGALLLAACIFLAPTRFHQVPAANHFHIITWAAEVFLVHRAGRFRLRLHFLHLELLCLGLRLQLAPFNLLEFQLHLLHLVSELIHFLLQLLAPAKNATLFFEFSLCLSRACLGKKMHFIYKWRKKWRFSHSSIFSWYLRTQRRREGGRGRQEDHSRVSPKSNFSAVIVEASSRSQGKQRISTLTEPLLYENEKGQAVARSRQQQQDQLTSRSPGRSDPVPPERDQALIAQSQSLRGILPAQAG